MIVSIGELEGAAGLCFREVFVRDAGLGVRGEAAGAGPDLHDAFFEFEKEALFLQAAEGRGGGGAGGEGTVGGDCGGEGVGGGFAGDEVVRVEGDGGLGEGEEEAELRGDEVAGEGGAGDSFAEDEAVVDGGDGYGGGAEVDY